MLDCEGPIVKALQNLVTQYDEIYFTWDEELYDEDRDDWTSSRWAALLDNVMKAPKDRLLQMQKCILPSLQQQRADLLESLNIADPPRDPGPRYLDALTEIQPTLVLKLARPEPFLPVSPVPCPARTCPVKSIASSYSPRDHITTRPHFVSN
ncbi:hypothetical protein Pst134EA_003393 [Puccinia striiformis f. sp. tritici]|uniref:hypothetical protein n=1 Tax=Puccinia striiformis f. sp. tritici TaxID=168172 RepID=UPI002008634F|nr:hypothetical protein Pst134EA_003393 [Puccinia striiformis f. sp. tritici]KAH9464962.1 hypothetical protein Pst134EB_004459 [Puccinia striiformis f. sp. tritici]KAH9472789.1 hypothetical protein Pst134EA_003393 [Puccinia striiformis f. sp. tritici]